jgi:hypothetical protein
MTYPPCVSPLEQWHYRLTTVQPRLSQQTRLHL